MTKETLSNLLDGGRSPRRPRASPSVSLDPGAGVGREGLTAQKVSDEPLGSCLCFPSVVVTGQG